MKNLFHFFLFTLDLELSNRIYLELFSSITFFFFYNKPNKSNFPSKKKKKQVEKRNYHEQLFIYATAGTDENSLFLPGLNNEFSTGLILESRWAPRRFIPDTNLGRGITFKLIIPVASRDCRHSETASVTRVLLRPACNFNNNYDHARCWREGEREGVAVERGKRRNGGPPYIYIYIFNRSL